ncbi:MAG: hypothetical protein EA403_03330 [Spirochaetaceae bacterium]|nr:MAG: hypothetical protein EA403_03330 [Spirochaetaceae bacterium]
MPRRTRLRRTGLLIALLAVYLVLFPRGTGIELQVSPAWITRIDDVDPSPPGNEAVFAVQTGDRFAFITATGRVLHHDEVLHAVVMRDDRFSNVSAVSAVTVIQDPRGGFLGAIPAEGYPLLGNRHTVVLHPDGATVSRWNDAADNQWTHAFGSVVTDIATGEELTVVGRLDGRLSVIDARGEMVFEYRSRAGRFPLVVSVAIDEHDQTVAALLDIEPQRLALFARNEEGFVLVSEISMPSAIRRPGMLRFQDNAGLLLWEQTDALHLLHRERGHHNAIELPGALRAAAVDPSVALLGVVTALSDSPDGVLILHHPGSATPVMQLPFPGGSEVLRMQDGLLLISSGPHLIAYRIERG